MTEPKRFNLWWLLAVAIGLSIIVFDITYADDGHGHNHHDDGGDVIVDVVGGDLTGGNLTGGDNVASISGGRSYGVSQSLGDVDINDCLASTQWGIPVIFAKQKVEENPWCQSIYLDVIGAHEAAAKVRCTTDTLKAVYPIENECIVAVVARPSVVVVPVTSDESESDEDDRVDVLYALFSDLEAQRNEDKAEAEKAAQRANARAQRAQRVQQAPDDAAERRAKARMALKGEE